MKFSTIVFVYVLLAIGWTALAMNIRERHERQDHQLRQAVANLWGAAHIQPNPSVTAPSGDAIAIDSTALTVDLNLDYRKKGMFWYSTYTADFVGSYRLVADTKNHYEFVFPLPSKEGMYSGFKLLVDGTEYDDYVFEKGTVKLALPLESDRPRTVEVRYRSQGSDEWWYDFRAEAGSTRNFQLTMKTNFEDIDFPDGSVSPNRKEASENGWILGWNYDDLLAGAQVGISLPRKVNPGPRLIDICLYAPLGLFLFLFVLTAFAVVSKVQLHPMHYVFLGAGYFSFHLLLVYLGDVTPLPIAFVVCAVVAVGLNVSYMQRAASASFAWQRVLPALVLYLVVFSSAFLVEGFRGLPLTMLLIVTLFILMQLTARIDWRALDAPVPPQDDELDRLIAAA